MKQRTYAWLVWFVLVAVLALRVNGLRFSAESDTVAREQSAYGYVRQLVHEHYVKEVDDKRLFYGAMNGMLTGLDRHSQFLPPMDYEQLRTSTSGQFEGVGIEFVSDDTQGLVVLTPLQGSPAFRGGVLPGDKLLAVDGVSVAGMKLEEAGRLIRGPVGTSVRLTLQHEGEKDPVDITLQRAVNEIRSIQAAELLTPPLVPEGSKIGYVQIAQFQARTGSDLDAALKNLESEGMQALVLDLRQNPGGLLESAKQVADLFLKDGVIVTVISRSANAAGESNVTYAQEAGTHPDYPLAILIDGHSASASEIVAGALKDRGRAVLVGEKSYGKFSVQDVFPVPLGEWGRSALKLTIARYQTPLSPCIDGQGLMPDYPVPLTQPQQRALQLSRVARHLRNNDPRAGKTAPPADNFDDLQLRKAVEVLAKRG